LIAITDTYLSKSTADADKALLRKLLVAMNAPASAMRLDECRCWAIFGRNGHAYTYGDGTGWLVYVAAPSARAWSGIRQRVKPFATVTQNGDDEGTLYITNAQLTQEAATALREIIGLKPRPRRKATAPIPQKVSYPRQQGGFPSQDGQSEVG
jgi:hypothetical protein